MMYIYVVFHHHIVCHMVLYVYCKMTYIFLHVSLELFALYIVSEVLKQECHLIWKKKHEPICVSSVFSHCLQRYTHSSQAKAIQMP